MLRWGKKNNPPLRAILQPCHPGAHLLKVIESWSLSTFTRKMLANLVFWWLILFYTHLLLLLQPSVLWLSIVTFNNDSKLPPKWKREQAYYVNPCSFYSWNVIQLAAGNKLYSNLLLVFSFLSYCWNFAFNLVAIIILPNIFNGGLLDTCNSNNVVIEKSKKLNRN